MLPRAPSWFRARDGIVQIGSALLTVAMVAVWCWKIGWLTGIAYLLFFSQIKRWIILRISDASRLDSEEDIPKMQNRMLTAVVVIHGVQLALLLFMLYPPQK